VRRGAIQLIVRMSKVSIIGPKQRVHATISAVHDLGTVHLEDAYNEAVKARPDGARPPFSRMTLDRKSDVLRRNLETTITGLNHAISSLEHYEPERLGGTTEVSSADQSISNDRLLIMANETLDDMSPRIDGLEAALRGLHRQLSQAQKYSSVLTTFSPLLRRYSPITGYETIALLINRRYADLLDDIEVELGAVTQGNLILTTAPVGSTTIAAVLIFKHTYSSEIRKLIWTDEIEEIRLPQTTAHSSYDDISTEIQGLLLTLPDSIASKEAELTRIAQAHGHVLRRLRDTAQDRLEELRGISTLGQTELTFVIKGWIPKHELDSARQRLEDQLNGQLILEEHPIESWELSSVPVSLHNSPLFKPFQALLPLIEMPRYGGIDPTPFLSLFFLLFFGFIVGDAGYGMLIALISGVVWYRYKGRPGISAGAQILIMAGLTAVFFGLLYGEFFGPNHLMADILPITIHRTSADMVIPFLIISLSIGVMHLTLGLIMGIMNSFRFGDGGRRLANAGDLLVITGLASLGVWALSGGSIPFLSESGWSILAVGVLVVAISSGPTMFLMKLVDTIRNIASYTRLMALGLASAFLALVANEMAGMTDSILYSALIAITIHSLNLVMSAFSPTLHSLRLNMLEFFSTFYEGGGRTFTPFHRLGDPSV